MKSHLSRFTHIFSVLILLAVSAAAQPLPKIELKQVLPNLQIDRPLWMSEAPDGSGRLFFVNQSGRILIVKKGSDGGGAKEFFNIENRNPFFENEDGLLSMAFHPGFKTNGLFYVYYTQQNPASQNLSPQNYPFYSVVSEFKVSAADPDKADLASERILLQVPAPYWNHKGGQISFGPDGYLYIAFGDGGPPSGNDPFGNGQNTATLLAKMLRIDVNTRGDNAVFQSNQRFGLRAPLAYGIPTNNPFAGKPALSRIGVRPEIFAYGLRNAWRYSFDRQTGDLWVADVGQDMWEEIDLVTNGGNYGWSVRESAHPFKPGPADAHYSEPVMEYTHRPDLQSEGLFPDHSIGLCVTGGYVYRGAKYPALQGVYVYGDYSLGTIWGFRYDHTAHKVTVEGTLLQQPKNIFSFAEDADGELYVLTESGQIFTITVP